jgi:hypothetical protein
VAQNTANADAVLKNYYLGPVREQLNQKAVLMFASGDDGAPRNSKGETHGFRGLSREAERIEFAGRQWIIPLHKSRNEGVGAIDEGGIIPVAGQQGWADIQDVLRHNLGSIEISRYAIRLSRQKQGAFIRLLQAETEGLVNDLRKDVNRQAYGNQTGALAAVTADGANTVTVDSVQYLRVGMRIDLIDSTNDTVLASNRTISAINATTKVVTYSGADATATTNHRLCRTGNWKREIHGLGNLIGSTGTIHNVDSTAAGNEYWKSIVFDNAGEPVQRGSRSAGGRRCRVRWTGRSRAHHHDPRHPSPLRQHPEVAEAVQRRGLRHAARWLQGRHVQRVPARLR